MKYIPTFSRVEIEYVRVKETVLESGLVIPKSEMTHKGYVAVKVVALGPEAFHRDGKLVQKVNVGDYVVCRHEHVITFKDPDGMEHHSVPDEQLLAILKE